MSKNNHYNPSLITTYSEQYFFLQNTYFPMPIFFPLNLPFQLCTNLLYFFSLYFSACLRFISPTSFFIPFSAVVLLPLCQSLLPVSDQLIAEGWYWTTAGNRVIPSPSTLPAYCSSVCWNKIKHKKSNSQKHF